MEKFHLDQYLQQRGAKITQQSVTDNSFPELCEKIRQAFLLEWEDQREDLQSVMRLQKNAMIGHEKEVAYFKDKIRSLIQNYGLSHLDYPSWYDSLEEAVYHENWGLSALAEWFSASYRESSSAKIIGDRIYFMESGRMIKKPQTITRHRREQLIRTFLLLTPEERQDKEFHEVYLLDGTRITIFGGSMTKTDQDVIIFRRYVVPEFSFEEQADRGTIPREAIPLFRAMVDLGYNVAFTGAVRTAKTTFLSTWQSYENLELEGVMVETDPEIPLHRLMPEAPIVQLLADNDRLRSIVKNLLRSDADYFVMAEARDGLALDTVVKIASKGTRRLKITFHTRDPLDFSYQVAAEIVKDLGGDVHLAARAAARSFDYVFHFIQLRDKSKKRLHSIHELSYLPQEDRIQMLPLCHYDYSRDKWSFSYQISQEKECAGREESEEAFDRFAQELRLLAEEKTV